MFNPLSFLLQVSKTYLQRNKLPKVIVVAGPTASGKSDFAVAYAKEHNGEIISADSRQVFKGLDLGTGKITQEETQGVPHHMLSIYEPMEEVSVIRYMHDALPIIYDILARGKTPVICGGSGQYIDALLFDIDFPNAKPNEVLRLELEKLPTEDLVSKLVELDPHYASTIDIHNRRRIIRAIEIAKSLGHVPTNTKRVPRFNPKVFLMNPSRDILKDRIEKRLEKRLILGMTEEVKDLLVSGVSEEWLKSLGLEYRYITQFLKQEITETEMKENIKNDSIHYAKRQMTWNRKYLPKSILIDIQ